MQINNSRINSIDILRGLVMVVMALDHVRDFFSDFKFQPTDLEHAGTIMFFTRWVTHFCAPVFIFLSGVSAFLSLGKGRTLNQEAYRLLTRGIWLIFLEFTFVRFGWTFNVDYSLIIMQVIWAIGVSMVVLSGLIFLPRAVILCIALVMISGHNLLDSLHPSGAAGVLWQFIHIQGPVHYGHGNTIFVIYPVVPWIGVMAAGYCFGALFRMPEQVRFRWQYIIGFSCIGLFILLRLLNSYGDPLHWTTQTAWWRTVLSFINCTKYPPSLLYLLMTIGPAIALLPVFEKLKGKAGSVMKVYGQVPLFYYLLHIYLIHGLGVLASYLFSGGALVSPFDLPGYALWVVYAVWLSAVVLLYFPCRWFAGIKKSHRKWWLSYL